MGFHFGRGCLSEPCCGSVRFFREVENHGRIRAQLDGSQGQGGFCHMCCGNPAVPVQVVMLLSLLGARGLAVTGET